MFSSAVFFIGKVSHKNDFESCVVIDLISLVYLNEASSYNYEVVG